MHAMWAPEPDVFTDFINEDCFLEEAPSHLNSQETITWNCHESLRQQLPQPLQQPQQLHSPPLTPEAEVVPHSDVQPHADFPIFPQWDPTTTTDNQDLSIWADPSDPFNLDFATTPNAIPVKDLPAPLEQLSNAPALTTPPLHLSTCTCSHPPTPTSLASSATTSPAPAIPSAIQPTLNLSPSATPAPILRTKPRKTKTYGCASSHCLHSAVTANPETTHHHHHRDPKRRFCCRFDNCTTCTSYSTPKDRKRHEESKHSGQRLICDCGHSTSRQDNMRTHIKTAHADGWEERLRRIVGVRIKLVLETEMKTGL